MPATPAVFNLALDPANPTSYRPPGYKFKDFSVVRDDAGTFHLHSIKTPWDVPNDYEYGLENMIGHTTTCDFRSYETHPVVLVADQDCWEMRGIIAPFVLRADGKWWMVYTGQSFSAGRSRLGLAYSDDLFHWRRWDANPVFDPSILSWPAPGGGGCRDPHVARFGDRYHLYYTADASRAEACVGVATSGDLFHWRDAGVALRAPRTWPDGGLSCCESSSVYAIDGRYLMTVKQYHPDGHCRHGTYLLWSDDPLRFDFARPAAFLDRVISMELLARRGDRLLFACFACVHWTFDLVAVTLDGQRVVEAHDNLPASEVAEFLEP